MTTTTSDQDSQREAPISALVRSLIADISLLVRREAQLARIEIKETTSKVGVAAGLIAGAATLALFAFGTLIAAAVLGLATVMPAWAAAVIVGLALLVVAVVVGVVGRRRMRAAIPLTPVRTIAGVQEDIAWIRRQTEQLKTPD
jgi:tetrahydromethanopterin S-methyltransferase subunit C